MYKSEKVDRSTRRDFVSLSYLAHTYTAPVAALKKSGAPVLFRRRINTSYEYARRGTQRAVIHHTRKVHAAVVPARTRAIRSVHMRERGERAARIQLKYVKSKCFQLRGNSQP